MSLTTGQVFVPPDPHMYAAALILLSLILLALSPYIIAVSVYHTLNWVTALGARLRRRQP